MNFSDELSEGPTPGQKPADAAPVWGPSPSPIPAEESSAAAGAQDAPGFDLAGAAAPPDPAWTGWDVLRLTRFAVVALFVGVFTVLLIASARFYPHATLGEVARVPLVIVAGQCAAYLLILAYMYVLATRERRRRPDFLTAFPAVVALLVGVFTLLIARARFYPHATRGEVARMPLVIVTGQCATYLLILVYTYVRATRERRRADFPTAVHWNFPSRPFPYLLAPFWFVSSSFRARFPRAVSALSYLFLGFLLSVALQGLAHLLPIPKELPIDEFFRTPAEAWALSILSVALAPLMEELFFRGFLYPVLERRLGLSVATFFTALAFALLHGAQLMFSWGPVLLIFLVGMILTAVRAKKNSVAACVLIHMAYNGTIAVAMFAATGGFRHLEKLNQ